MLLLYAVVLFFANIFHGAETMSLERQGEGCSIESILYSALSWLVRTQTGIFSMSPRQGRLMKLETVAQLVARTGRRKLWCHGTLASLNIKFHSQFTFNCN